MPLHGGADPGGPPGRTPGSAADAPVGLLAPCKMPTPLGRLRDEGVLAQRAPRPGGPPHDFRGIRGLDTVGKSACATAIRAPPRNGCPPIAARRPFSGG